MCSSRELINLEGSVLWPPLLERRHIPPDPLSPQSLQDIEDWISECSNEHLFCRHTIQRRPVLPRRVLKIDSATDPLTVRLVESDGEKARYIALSYCWGKANLLKTTTKNLESHKHRIEWDSLAKAYQHCITLAVRLGVQFVWIDALCILQDSDPDWRRESSNMGKVYENAYLVIAASLAIDGDDGFFFDRSEYKELELPDKEHRQWPPAPPGNVFARVYEPQHAPFRDQWVNPVRDAADDLPLFGRAWAFQERILATRVLHFTPFEMLWECRTRIQCECGQNDERNPGGMKFNFAEALRPGHALLQDRNATWGDIVGEYTSRDLTFAKDKLVALSATAQQMSHRWLGQYVAGMWNNFLLDSLLWVRHSREDYPKPRHEEHVAPTWSWASVDGQIRDNPENVPSRDLKYWLERDLWHRGTWPEVVDVQVETVGDDKFGALKSGHLKLRGRIFHAVLRNPDDRKYSIEHTISPPSSESEEEPTVLEETFTPDVDLSQGVSVTSDGSPLIGLLFRAKASQKLYALIFKYSTREPDTFERIGIAVLSPEWNSGLEIKTLTIV